MLDLVEEHRHVILEIQGPPDRLACDILIPRLTVENVRLGQPAVISAAIDDRHGQHDGVVILRCGVVAALFLLGLRVSDARLLVSNLLR